LAEKVSELTDFTNFGVEEKKFTDTDQLLALAMGAKKTWRKRSVN
jgi:hypothetical protein